VFWFEDGGHYEIFFFQTQRKAEKSRDLIRGKEKRF
jgi:hypothetical protein